MVDAVERIATWAEDPRGILIIDDLDRIFDEKVEQALLSLPEDSEGRWQIIATVCRLENLVEKESWSGSPSVNTFHRIELNPWSSPRSVKAALKNGFDELRSDLEHRGNPVHPALLGQMPNLIEAWIRIMLEVSEGHPAILRAAFESLVLLLQKNFDDVDSEVEKKILQDLSDTEEWESLVRQHIEDHVMHSKDGLTAIDNAIRYFKANSRYFKDLFELSREANGRKIEDPFLRQELIHSGLVYRDPFSGRLCVAGALTRRQIQRYGDSSEPAISELESRPQVSYELRPIRGKVGGILELDHPEGKIDLRFRGAPWAILVALDGHKGRWLSVAAIGELAALPTEAATRSALQRLNDRLKEKGLGDLISNKRGFGYKIKTA